MTKYGVIYVQIILKVIIKQQKYKVQYTSEDTLEGRSERKYPYGHTELEIEQLP